MKVLTIDNIRKGDQFTIANEPIDSIDLMERASKNCADWIQENTSNKPNILVFVGPGNNGGDGLAIARLLKNAEYNVSVVLIEFTKKYSVDFAENLNRYKAIGGKITIVSNADDSFVINDSDIIIDAIFGSGLSRAIDGFTVGIVDFINSVANTVISIDIPSGLMGDKLVKDKNPKIIRANHTLSIASPKQVFFLQDAYKYVGSWHHIDIGISPMYQQMVAAEAYYIEKGDILLMLKKRDKFSHKGNYGHALLIAGSTTKIGAAVLASKAALRSGIGLLTTHIPKSARIIMQTSSPETMLSIDEDDSCFSGISSRGNYDVIGIGPGLGIDIKSQRALKKLIQENTKPLVFDADALNVLSENKTWLSFLPVGSILTPHVKEFERLAGKSSNSQERIIKQKEFSIKNRVFVVLKGANTSISTPDGKLFYNSTGNPGMATAGSGDVLTGIILSLLAQSYEPQYAAILGVYIHGLAGDIAAIENGFEALIASDIIDNLGKAFISVS